MFSLGGSMNFAIALLILLGSSVPLHAMEMDVEEQDLELSQAAQIMDHLPPELRREILVADIRHRGERLQGCSQALRGQTVGVRSVCYSPDGGQIASGSGDNTVRLWDRKSGVLLHTLADHTGGVLSVCYSPDGGQIASGSDDRTVRLWRFMRPAEKLLSIYSDAPEEPREKLLRRRFALLAAIIEKRK